jgi:hypothetical protein
MMKTPILTMKKEKRPELGKAERAVKPEGERAPPRNRPGIKAEPMIQDGVILKSSTAGRSTSQ